MPVSEDEFERPVQTGPNSAPLSKAEQRKNNKPIMEKRRRARINHCLNELKTLILDAMKKDPARHSKLEKADILEMTVKHLQQIQRQQLATAVATDPNVIMRFKSGFDECAAEVSRYISRLEGIDSGVKQRLTAHLHRCVSGLQQVSAFPHQNIFATLAQNCDKSSIVLPTVPAVPGDVNNNSNQNGERIQIPSGLHLIPSRLPTGELALLVPNSSHISTFLNAPPGATFQFPPNTTVGFNSVLGSPLGGSLGSNLNHASAFTAVSKNQDYPSPTSTADIIKKEPNLSEKEDLMSSAYLNHSTESTYHQSYHFNVTENKDPQTQDSNYKNSKVITASGQDANDPSYRKHGLGAKFYEGVDYEGKISQKATSTSFQRNVADSTTSCIQSKDEDLHETGFKPFQVDIPNSHLKAHISIPKNQDDEKSPPTLQIHQKPNPNFVLNPNKSHQKSTHLSIKAFNHDEFSKIKSSSEEGKTFTTLQLGCFSPSSSSTTDLTERNGKRPLPNESPEMSSTTFCGEPIPKIPRISLDVTPAENQQSNNEPTTRKDRCKRISVIVEDSSKTAGRDNSNEIEIPMSASTQKDMWRPW